MASMSLQAAYDQARQWLESNDLNRAIGLAQYILEHYPDNLDAYRILGEAYLANRQLDRAQEAFERVLRSDPENIPAHVGLGITFERQGRLDRAIPEFEQALEIKPDMPELRSQLLRLYSEAWGSEHAQLRLSRAGLARLYAKGHMLPQAINEFRQVISTDPQRFDAMVAMAEALWRDGQEDAAVALCRDILAKRPESLKANLILGYLEMAGGQPEGERAWRAAQGMDPYQIVARAVFDTLPPESSDEPTLEEWDEAAWRQRRAEEQQERLAATRPMEAVTPVGTPVESAGNGARMLPPPPPPPRPAPVAESDDFLANLLSINTPPPPPPVSADAQDLDLDLDMAPFSLDDLDGGTSAPQPAAPSSPAPEEPADEPAMAPFSLADLGLSDDEIAGLESLSEAPSVPAAPAAEETDELAMTPFSLADLGLSDDEIAGLESLSEAPSAPAAPAAEETDEPAMTPFSLADLGLSDDEIAGLETPPAPAEPPQSSRITQVISREELGDFGAKPAADTDDEPALTPFSLADLGLSDDEIAGLDSLGAQEEAAPRPPAGRPAAPRAAESEGFDAGDLPVDLQPFSLDELDLNTGAGAPSIGGLGSSLQPFSFDEPQRPRVSGFMADESFESAPDEQEPAPETGGFSWQEPTQKPQPGFLKSLQSDAEPGEGSIFAKLRQRHEQEERVETPPPPPPPIGEDEHLGLFSMDNISLRDDEDLAPARTAPEPPAPAEPAPAAPLEVDSLQDAVDAGLVQPFSLADLGLSEEEIAALGLGDTSPQEAAPEAAPEVAPPAESTGRSSAYTLDDLEPVEPESVASETAQQSRASDADEGIPVTGELQPFSLTDLGLSDEEIAALGLDSSTEPETSIGSELGITEEDLEGLGLDDLNWSQPPALAAPPVAEAPPADTNMPVTSGDLLVDRLLALGREQGYVDISDIIAAFDDPEAEAERIEQIGQRLHEARIEIRDGDEVIDMDAEYAEEEEAPAYAEQEQAAPADEEPAMTPFSLNDLGLSDEEIASLGLGEAAPAAPEPEPEPEPEAAAPEAAPAPADEEPVMTPFSLSDLGLSDAEIAALGLGEATPAAPEPEPEAAAPADEEPVMTPFSLSDLGLSDAEIAALGLGQAPAAPEPEAAAPEAASAPADEEPVMTPFSLSDLGLSDAEIAALGLGANDTTGAASDEPAATETPQPEPQPEPPAVAPPSEAPAVAAATPPEPPAEPPPAPEAPASVPAAAASVPAAAPAAPAEKPRGRSADQPPGPSGNDMLDTYVRRLDADPQNHILRLSVARASGQLGMADFAIQQYRYMIKHNALLDMISDDLQDLIADVDDRQLLKRLHRTLGDVYTKQGNLAEAMDEYTWTPAGS